MSRLSHTTVVLLVGISVLNGLHGWLRVAERAGYSPPPAVSWFLLGDALERRAEVQADLAATLERRRRAEELATAVVEGRLTLREGAARLRDMYRAAPDFPWQAVERRFPEATDEERCCRLLIGEVRSLEGPERERARAVATRLEGELEADLRRGHLSL